jgi:hypothetical protein
MGNAELPTAFTVGLTAVTVVAILGSTRRAPTESEPQTTWLPLARSPYPALAAAPLSTLAKAIEAMATHTAPTSTSVPNIAMVLILVFTLPLLVRTAFQTTHSS